MRASLHNHPTSGLHTTSRRSSRLQHQTHQCLQTLSSHYQQHHRSLVCRHSSNGDTQQPVLFKQWSDLFSQFLAADQLPASSIHNDTLSQAQQQLQKAAEVEDYETAAQLRDGSLAWLGGWYRPAANPQARGVNSSSSLLYVSHTETNRWTGLLFTPADFMHFDLQGNCNMSELQMDDMLQQPRYGTPLFEVFVLPQAQQHQQADNSTPAATPTSSTAPTPPADGSAAIPSSAPSTPSTPAAANTYSSSTFMPVVVALQSVNRAFNELLGVQPSRRRDPAAPNQPRLVNQRLMLLVQQHRITAAAVHAGNDATLWTWHLSTAPAEEDTTHPNTDSISSTSTSTSTSATYSCREGDSDAVSVVSGPLRPAGASGGCRSGLTIDQYSIDHLRGPGSLARSKPDSFTFCRQPLPADVLSVLCSGSSGGWDGSSVQLFRVDLQYSMPPPEPAEATEPGVAAADDPAAAAAGSQQGAAASSDSSSRSTGDNSWAQRVAAELCGLLNKQQVSSSSSSSSTGLQQSLSELLAAAAVGSAPPGGVVSEVQQAVGVVEVQLGGSSSDEATATPPAVEFVRVVEPTATLSFGGWQVTASLT